VDDRRVNDRALHRAHPAFLRAFQMKKWKNPLSAFEVIAANKEQPVENADRIMVEIRMAYEKLKMGTGDHEQFDRLAAALNVGMIRAEQIDPRAVPTMKSGVAAMMRCDGRYSERGAYGFSRTDEACMNDAIDLYEGIVRLSTPKQMINALTIAMRRMRQVQILGNAK
jgi:hypothetical protein